MLDVMGPAAHSQIDPILIIVEFSWLGIYIKSI